jgi:hypothetical protein
MLKVFEDKGYENHEKNHAFASGTNAVNHHAASLVLSCLIKLMDSIIPILDSCFDDL